MKARNYTPEAIERVKAKFQGQVATIRSLNVKFKTTREFSFDGFGYFYGLFRQYQENGVLPFEGCHADQPAKIMEIFDVFEQLHYEKQAKQMDEIRKKNK